MGLFTIDTEKCRRDGLCALVCPASLIRQPEEGAYPVAWEGKEEFCIRCGHCLAVCPHEAISLDAMPDAALTPVRRELGITFEQAAQFMKSRRAIRHFSPEPVPEADIREILDVARYAPSGHNDQPVKWLVLQGRPRIEAFLDRMTEWMREEMKAKTELVRTMHLPAVVRGWSKGKDYILLGAPTLVMAYAPAAGVTPDMDAVIAASWFDLAAHARGYGACWAGYVTFALRYKPELKEGLGIPMDHEVKGALMLGKARVKYRRIPPRNPADVRFSE